MTDTRECTYKSHPAWIVGRMPDGKILFMVRRPKDERGPNAGPCYAVKADAAEIDKIAQ